MRIARARSVLALILAIVGVSCRSAKTWDRLVADGVFAATLKTSLRDDVLYYQLTITLDPTFYHDSIPSKALMRLYDSDGFEVLNIVLPVASTGSRGEVYVNGQLRCPQQRRATSSCNRPAYESAVRWTLLPYANSPDPFKR